MNGSASPRFDMCAFWAKAGDGASSHPVICHMVDVGSVVRAFLERPGAGALRRRLATGLGISEAVAIRLVAFLCAAHDIGKISAGFQRKREDLWRVLVSLGYRSARSPLSDHGSVTQIVLKRFLKRRTGDLETALSLARLVAAHHGSFPQLPPLAEVEFRDGPWAEAQDKHLEALESVFEPDWEPLQRLQGEAIPPGWLMSLAGIASVCDWIGSSTDHFEFEPDGPKDLPQYAARSAHRAAGALERVGLTGWAPPRDELDFRGTFGFEPNAMQRTVIERARGASGQLMLVIEAPMGLGKTEASLAAADELMRRHELGGIYYALPTQATSNQMFGRLVKFLEKRCAGMTPDVHLLHGLSDLNETYRDLRIAAIEQDPDATVRASTWFTARRRGLLAPFGVGTVDQALLAGMVVRHMFVRLAGLADKVVVLDEVHAYDTYMSELLDHVVTWLAALGSSVVVLSATLPTQRRHELIAAFGATGAKRACGYPQVTVAAPGEPATASAPAGPSATTLRVERLDSNGDDLERVARQLAAQLAGGGCAVWICNTVDRAQSAFEEVRRALPNDCEHLLFHARFPTGARLEIEERVLRAFGKSGRRPHRAVLVATQVVEQSLDLDFDYMVTDLAPVDLMLQRAGRLHRHPGRARPAGLESPTLCWIEPPIENGLPALGVHEYVYERVVLLRTWLAIGSRSEFVLPTDVPRLVEAVYGTDDGGVDEYLRGRLAEAQRTMDRRQQEHAAQAQEVLFVSPLSVDKLFAVQATLDDDETSHLHHTLKARTRLTRPSVTVVCATRGGGELRLLDGSPLDLAQAPERGTVRRIRLSSLAVHRWEWFRYFAAQPVPLAWRRVAALRDVRVAEFAGGKLTADGLKSQLELSPELGLVIRDLSKGA